MKYLQTYTAAIESHIQEISQYPVQAHRLYEPVAYILSLGGKRLRPVFVLMACHLYDENFKKALPAAGAIEVFHNFTLVHDDIMDNAFVRRGKPTVHENFSVNQAILSGDVMMIKSFQSLLTYDAALANHLIKIMTEMAVALCEGQQMDMDFESESLISIPEYLEMIEKKTAVLLGAALKMGASIGGASASDGEHLYQFGKNFGIAFQLQDDVLDTFGTPEQVGKRIGGDILQRKKTYLFLKALELGDQQQKAKLLQLYGSSDAKPENDKINLVTQLFTTLGVQEYATQVMEAYRDLAVSHLNQCSIPQEKKLMLTTLVNDFLHRDH